MRTLPWTIRGFTFDVCTFAQFRHPLCGRDNRRRDSDGGFGKASSRACACTRSRDVDVIFFITIAGVIIDRRKGSRLSPDEKGQGWSIAAMAVEFINDIKRAVAALKRARISSSFISSSSYIIFLLLSSSHPLSLFSFNFTYIQYRGLNCRSMCHTISS